MKRKLLLAALCVAGALGFKAQAQTFSEGKYYLQNVESGLYWGAGNSWGTQASLLVHPEYVTLHPSDGTYTLESQVSNGGTAYYFNGSYMDNDSPVSLTITASGDYYTIANGTTYYGYDGSSTVLGSGLASDSQNALWKIISEADMIASLGNATVDSPVDATFLLLDPNFGRNNRNSGSWTHTSGGGDFQLAAGDVTNYNMQQWNSTFDLYQTISSLPNGFYKVTAQGYYRDGSNAQAAANHAAGTETIRTSLYANSETAFLMSVIDDAQSSSTGGFGTEAAEGVYVPNSQTNASACFSAGYYNNNVIYVNVTGGTLKIGATCTENVNNAWTVIDNFTLTYYGTEVSSVNEIILADFIRAYKEALAAASAYSDVDMFDADKTILTTAISDNTLELNSATEESLSTATSNLNAAATAAAVAASKYAAYTTATTLIAAGETDLTSALTNASFEAGNLSAWTSEDGGNVASNNNFSGKVGTYFVERWKNNVALGSGSLTHDVITLPAGVYTITANAQNIEQYNSSAAGTGYFFCVDDEQKEIGAAGTYSITVKYTAETNDVTLKFLLNNCTGNWISCDNIVITYIGEDFPAVTLASGKMNATVSAAQTAAKEAYDANGTVANYNALVDAVTAAQASVEAYASAANAISNANALLEAHNFASTAAASTFAEAIAEISDAYDANTLTTDEATAAGTTLGSVVTGWRSAANSAAVAYLNNGFSLNAFDAALYINTWSTEGEGDGSNFKVPFYEYFAGDGSSLGENTWTGTLSGLENGLYEVSAWVRVRTKNDDTAAADATGIFMNVNGGTAIDVTEGTQIGESRFQLKEYTAEGLVKDGTLNVNFVINAENNIHWLSFKNVSYTKVRDLTEEEAAVVPTAIALYNGEDEVTETIALNETTNTVTLTPSYTPANATEGYITWTSSDETVATVADGVVTAVSSGSAIITATSTLDENVYATATVTVSYPESTVPEFVNNGATRTVYNFGPNLIKNGSFEYPDAYYGWTVGTGAKMTSTQFSVEEEDGDHYIQAKLHNGSNAAGSLRQAWPIEPGKKYLFGYKVKNASNRQVDNNNWFRVSLCNANPTSGDGTIIETYPSYNGTWTEYAVVVDNTSTEYTYVQAHFRWLNENSTDKTAFNDFFLCEILSDPTTVGNVDYATAAIPTVNVGTGAFQYSQDAVNAANALVQGTATVEDVQAAYDALTILNVPEETQAYNLVFNCEGHTATGNALTLIPNPSQTQGLYGLKYLAPANVNLAQAFYFVHTTGNKYKLCAIGTDGNPRYITTATLGYGRENFHEGLRVIEDAEKALEVEIRPNTDGEYILWNTLKDKAIAHNGNNNNDAFTNYSATFSIVATSKPSITINTTAAGWGTTMLPFAVAELPEGVKAYTCAATQADGTTLELEEVNALEANKPYIIEGSWEETLTGDAQGTDLTYTQGWLTGVYAATAAPVGSYVLQNNDKVGFYQVAEGKQPTVGANRAYLTVPEEAKSRAAFFFEADDATAISTIAAMTAGEVEGIYTIGGAKVQSLQKGVNILKMKNGQTRKVIVK